MANPIIPKRNSDLDDATPPGSGALLLGELATNVKSGKVYLKANSGVIELTEGLVASSQLTSTSSALGVVQLLGTGKISTTQIAPITTAQLSCLTQTAVANLVPQLGNDGKIPSELLPASISGSLVYKGAWTPNNNPLIQSGGVVGGGVAAKGDYYVADSTITLATAIDGISDWIAGDMIAFDGTVWAKIHGASAEIISVNNVGPVNGNVTLSASDVGAIATTTPTTLATANGIPKLTAAGKLSTLQLVAATTAELGAIRVGTGLSINESGILSANGDGYTLEKASSSVLGGVKIGSGIAIDGNGVITPDNTIVITTSSTSTTFNGGLY